MRIFITKKHYDRNLKYESFEFNSIESARKYLLSEDIPAAKHFNFFNVGRISTEMFHSHLNRYFISAYFTDDEMLMHQWFVYNYSY